MNTFALTLLGFAFYLMVNGTFTEYVSLATSHPANPKTNANMGGANFGTTVSKW